MYKDPNYVYRTFSPKVIHYGNDGCGRDSYIRGNHGGLMHRTNYQEIALPTTSKYQINSHRRSNSTNCLPIDGNSAFSCQKLIPSFTFSKEKLPAASATATLTRLESLAFKRETVAASMIF